MSLLLRIPFALVFWVFTAGLVLASIDHFQSIRFASLWLLGLGAGFYFAFLIGLSFFKRSMHFAHTFCHELNHAFFSVLFLKKIKAFQAHAEKGGQVSFEGKNNLMITLAPYSVPLFALFTVLLKLLAEPRVFPAIHFVVGFFISFHLHSVFSEFRLYQSDLRVYGFFLSLAFVVFINTLFLLWIVSVVAEDFQFSFLFLKRSFFELRYVGSLIIDFVSSIPKLIFL